jgi:hypothetical protein
MLSIKRDESFLRELRKGEEEADSGTSTPNADSQSSISTAATSITEASTAASSFSSEDNPAPNTTTTKPTEAIKPPPISAPEGIPDLLRLRTAFNFILSAYVPPHLHTPLTALLTTSPSLADFSPLDAHLAHLRTLRQEALAARNLNDMSRKRGALDDEEDEIRAEKKRKLEEDEKRKKAGESRAVKNLKKVNVSGMKKMSDFFKKKV